MFDRLNAARMKIFDGSGHAPFLARDIEFNRTVQEFVQEVYGRD
jgi:pimeloyl-ACP methyl ester carboxylesterase